MHSCCCVALSPAMIKLHRPKLELYQITKFLPFFWPLLVDDPGILEQKQACPHNCTEASSAFPLCLLSALCPCHSTVSPVWDVLIKLGIRLMRKSHAFWLSGWHRVENAEFETMLTICSIKDSNLNIRPVGCC